ncbi:hypothetical protein ELI49_14545 [Rhizobium ruizarguesonis]|uniref:Uncharacterized protein n=1 Tax=Rhizobium ruizarguesonis TaxID=2081791 RepID=A0AAE8QE84_9HYPH|nr:hypothetical protein [Rhizobium ruizarguesonis]NKJ72867.1 hypothetical protein [Rhizobium leguminosarum bv. viciae]NEH35590.1 hypothetical protein [Rhizobium ruizarguesonis]NEH84071.1 hypothetical protein [Rhizobium ruizarguesonis]NEI12131.1 hypothetical protein [Rhizobium ruizarguesonis]
MRRRACTKRCRSPRGRALRPTTSSYRPPNKAFIRFRTLPDLLHRALNRNRFKDKIMRQFEVLQRPLRA